MRAARKIAAAAAAATIIGPFVFGGAGQAAAAVQGGAPAAAAAGTWKTALEVPGTAALNAGAGFPGGGAVLSSVSCASADNCSGGGNYTDSSGHRQVFVVNEVNGTWQTAIQVPGTAALNAGGAAVFGSVSCASAGNCSGGGRYTDSSGFLQAFVVNEVNGTWQTAIQVPGTGIGGGAELSSVSCGSAGNCSADGEYYVASAGRWQAFVVNEVNGTWQTVMEAPGVAALNGGGGGGMGSLSCASAGNCSAIGAYGDSSGHRQAFVANEVNGTWQTAIAVPGIAALGAGGAAVLFSVSCGSAGNCSAVGEYRGSSGPTQAFVANEVNGTWQTAIAVPGIAALGAGGAAVLSSVSCASAGNCSAGGTYPDSSGNQQVFVVNEVNGTWQTAIQVPGIAALGAGGSGRSVSVSCASAGNCSAGGYYWNVLFTQAFVANEVNGTWQTATAVPGIAALGGSTGAVLGPLSCGSAGNCSAGGDYGDSSGHVQAFVVSSS